MPRSLSVLLARTGLLLGAFLCVVGVATAVNMTEPAGSPPSGNIAPSVNTSINNQVTDTGAGKITTKSFGSSDGYALGSYSSLFVDTASGRTTMVAAQYCIGTDPTSAAGNTCITTFPNSDAYHIERTTIMNIPSALYGGNGHPYEDMCAVFLRNAGGISGLTDANGWIATGSDGCANYGGSGDNCNGSHKVNNLQCTYMRLVKGTTGVAATSLTRRYDLSQACDLWAQPTRYCAFDRDGIAVNTVGVVWSASGATQFTIKRTVNGVAGAPQVVTPADNGTVNFPPPAVGETDVYTGTVTAGAFLGSCSVTVTRGSNKYCSFSDDGSGNLN